MPLLLVTAPDYHGATGVLQVTTLQHDLSVALVCEDWAMVRRLDKACITLIDKVIAANNGDSKNDNNENDYSDNDASKALILALSELKDVYANLIMKCHHKVAAMAR